MTGTQAITQKMFQQILDVTVPSLTLPTTFAQNLCLHIKKISSIKGKLGISDLVNIEKCEHLNQAKANLQTFVERYLKA